jgi:hypothetical protein
MDIEALVIYGARLAGSGYAAGCRIRAHLIHSQ